MWLEWLLALHVLPSSSSPDLSCQRCSWFADKELTHICQTAPLDCPLWMLPYGSWGWPVKSSQAGHHGIAPHCHSLIPARPALPPELSSYLPAPLEPTHHCSRPPGGAVCKRGHCQWCLQDLQRCWNHHRSECTKFGDRPCGLQWFYNGFLLVFSTDLCLFVSVHFIYLYLY